MKINKFNLKEFNDYNNLNLKNIDQVINKIKENLEYLELHNKSYNKDQYYKILECLDLIKCIESED